jgi:hypothetical protein
MNATEIKKRGVAEAKIKKRRADGKKTCRIRFSIRKMPRRLGDDFLV